ncbi:MAG: hypothetical protein QM791_01950 [Ferruginibacter sp.]
MMKRYILFLVMITAAVGLRAQYQVHVEDIPRFWKAYDLFIASTDSAEQVKIIQTEYLDKGTAGLKEFNNLRSGTAVNYRKFINNAKGRLQKIRPYTLSVLDQKAILDKKLEHFKKLYPKLKVGDVFFTIGIGNSGGTTQGSHVLIGCEVAATEKPDWAISLTLHEFVHTQQNPDTSFNLLSQCIMEGAAEFIMEQVNERKISELSPRGYIAFGLMNEKETWEKFKNVMFASDSDNTFGWIYGGPGVEVAGIRKVDMGYYIGYRICKSYYDKATDKAKAISDIIELPYNRESAREFIIACGYVPKEDLDFVSHTAFRKQPAREKPGKKINYGVIQDSAGVTFIYEAPKQLLKTYIDSVMVAGSFNDWSPALHAYKMKNNGSGKFELHMPKSSFRKGEQYSFKFVLNGNEWLLAPEDAANKDNSGYDNLVFVAE